MTSSRVFISGQAGTLLIDGNETQRGVKVIMEQKFRTLTLWLKGCIFVGFVLWAIAGTVTALTPAGFPRDSTYKPVPDSVIRREALAVTPTSYVPVSNETAQGKHWVDSVLNALTLDEKIGQLFMIGTYSNRGESESRGIEQLITQYHIGGLLFFQGSPFRQAVLTNRYQAVSKVPLLIGIDAEWGLGMRLDSTVSFPRQMTLGAIDSNRLIYEMGSEIGRQCNRLGVHVNFAPVVDINSNPRNPVIGSRSFGENRENVTQKALSYMKGLQHRHVLAAAKHFPGHGDTDADSHYTLPVVNRSKTELAETELYPYRRLVRDSLAAIVSAHLFLPQLDNTPRRPASLSPDIINGLLRKELGFKGLVFTDAMNMRGVLQAGKAPDVNFMALQAGNDMLLAPEAVAATVQKVKDELNKGAINRQFIDAKVRRILAAKFFAGLHRYSPVNTARIRTELTPPEAIELKERLGEAAVTLVRNDSTLLPLWNTGPGTASLAVGEAGFTSFQKTIGRYAPTDHFSYPLPGAPVQERIRIQTVLAGYKTILVALHGVSSNSGSNYHIPAEAVALLRHLKQNGKKIVLCIFGNPYSLSILPEADAILCAYQDSPEIQRTVAEIIYGAHTVSGTLPVSAGTYKSGTHVSLSATGRIGYASPESVNVNGQVLGRINQVVGDAIAQHAFPGCQVLVAYKGKVIFDKSYGSLEYSRVEPVTHETLYDLASITKVAATLQAVMLLYDQKAIDLDQKASYYLPELAHTDKANFTIRDLLIHRSGLVSFYPRLWENTMAPNRGLSATYYQASADSTHALRVAPTLFARTSLKDSVWKWIIESPMHRRGYSGGKPVYVYSDLGFLTLQKIVERIAGTTLDDFINTNLYKPLGITKLLFNPLDHFPSAVIAPTEQDKRFRNELIRGTVHDQMAAINGGVAGHAGLFGNAFDLAVLAQMQLWKGKYANTQYIHPETIALFTALQSKSSHRGLGWEKPKSSPNSTYVSEIASDNSYGHTGFTGNVVWIDPDKELIYIFLSNRVNPSPENNRINALRVRRRIHDIVYEALLRNLEVQ